MSGHFTVGTEDAELYSMTDGLVRPDRNIPLDAVSRLSAQDPFWANRGKAIQAYATLEQSLCNLFSDWGGMSREVAATIFFKITSAQARNSILEKLLRQKHGNTYNLFWNSYLKQLHPIDTKRNEIVHWTATTSVYLDARSVLFVGVSIVPPTIWATHRAGERILSRDLIAFANKCDVYARLANMFHGTTSGIFPTEGVPATWQPIFQQPLVYPLPEGHPLNTPLLAPDTPPQSFRV